MRILVMVVCMVTVSGAARAGEVDMALGVQGQATSWDDDAVGYSSASVGYFVNDWFGLDFTGKLGLASVDDRLLEYFDVGAVFRGRLGRARPRLRVGVTHQHEISSDALEGDFAGNAFGWGDGIRHRGGLSTDAGIAVPIGRHQLGGDISLTAGLGLNYFLNPEKGPEWYWGAGVGVEMSFAIGGGRRAK